MHDSGGGGELRTVTDIDMIRKADRPAHANIFSNVTAA